MSHLVVPSPFVSNQRGPGYDSPGARRAFGYSNGLPNSPLPFRKAGDVLPKWLQFKDYTSGPTKTEQENLPERNARRGSTFSIRSNTIGNELYKKIQEHRSTEDWERERQYREARRRRRLLEKKQSRKLRMVRHLYKPAILCILLGATIIMGSTIQSLGGNSVFWSFRDQFKIIGPIVTVLGCILLLVTVGLENCEAEKLKQKGVILVNETKSLIHPDFSVTSDTSRRTSTDSSTFKTSTSSKQNVSWKDLVFGDKMSVSSSSFGPLSSLESSFDGASSFNGIENSDAQKQAEKPTKKYEISLPSRTGPILPSSNSMFLQVPGFTTNSALLQKPKLSTSWSTSESESEYDVTMSENTNRFGMVKMKPKKCKIRSGKGVGIIQVPRIEITCVDDDLSSPSMESQNGDQQHVGLNVDAFSLNIKNEWHSKESPYQFEINDANSTPAGKETGSSEIRFVQKQG